MDEICRLCSSTKFVNNNIFDEKNALFIKMSLYLPIKIQKGDRLPQRICDRCSCKVNDFYQFCNEAIEVQNKFKAIISYDKETDTSIDVTLIKRDSPLPRCDDKEADTSIDVTLIKSEISDSPILRCDKSTQTLEPTTNLPEVKITEEPKQTVPAPIKEELPDDDYMPVLPSDSDDEVLSKIQSRKYFTSQNVKEQENGMEKNHRKTNKKSKVKRKKKVPAKVLTENDVNVLQEDNRVRPQDPGVDIDSLGENSHGAHFCCICFKSFTDYNKADMLRHYKTHVNRAVLRIRTPRAPPLPAEKPFRCQRCRKTVLKAKYWGAHWRHHWKQDRRLYHCGMCDLTYRSENQIFIHGKTHKPGEERKEQPKPYMCDSCPETFQLSGCLLAHRTRAHFETVAQQMFLRCSTCKRSFTHLASLDRHQRVHTGERKYRCKVCGKALTSREILKNHMRIHTGYKPVECSVCGFRLSAMHNLKKHMRVHTGEKPYECSHCGKAFSQSSALNVHKRYHTGERPYKCEQCGRSYVARALLTVHLRTCTDQSPPKKKKGKGFSKNEEIQVIV